MRKTKCLFDEQRQTPEGMVSVSQLQSFMSCAKKWEYGYVENLTPRVERPYLSIGKLCHKGMQVAMQTVWEDQQTAAMGPIMDRWAAWLAHGLEAMKGEWLGYIRGNSFLAEEMPEQEQILTDAMSIFKQAFEEFEPWKYEVISVKKDGKLAPALELHFVVPCAGSKGLHGYIDAILRDRNTGFTWCTDYKFRKSLSPDEEEETNVQNAVYTHACQKMGVPITGTMTWQHCNTPAAEPALLKNGGVSRAKIKTTWPKYAQFCRDHDIDPAPYEDEMREKLADIEWFRATYEYRNPIFVDGIWKDVIVPAAYAVKSAHGKAPKNKRSLYPWNCKTCQYKSICQGELRGYDTDAIRLAEYVVRPRKSPDKSIIDKDPAPVV